MTFFKSPSGVTFLTEEPLTQDQLNNELADEGVNLVDAEEWNNAVARNTVADDGNDFETEEEFRTALPKSVDPYDGLEVKGQGIHSSCFAAGFIGVAEDQYYQETGEVERFAIWPTYMVAQQFTKGLYGTDGGTVPTHGVKAATEVGFMKESTARKYLPSELVEKWLGDVYPRGYWSGTGNFEQTAQRGYTEACRAYEEILKREDVREEMYENRLLTIIPSKRPESSIEALKAKTGTILSCHKWTPDCDSHPGQIQSFSGQSHGGQHSHHATFEAWISAIFGTPIKANSWREFQALMMAKEQGTQDLDVKEWGDDGLKAWLMDAYRKMYRDNQSYNYICSNMTVSKKPSSRIVDTSDHRKFR